MAQKSVSSGETVLDIAANIAVCAYNNGLSTIIEIMEKLDGLNGQQCYDFCMEAGVRRIKLSERLLTDYKSSSAVYKINQE